MQFIHPQQIDPPTRFVGKKRLIISFLLAICVFSTTTFAPKEADAYVPLAATSVHPFKTLFTPLFSTFATFQELYLNMVLTGMGDHGNFTGSKILQLLEANAQNEGKVAPDSEENVASEETVTWRNPDVIREEVQAKGDPIPSYFPYNELWFTVAHNETSKRIEEMYKYKQQELAALNPTLDLDHLQPGQRVLVWKRSPIPSQSVGKANHGRLLNGEPLRPTEAFMVLYQHRVFGTTHSVALIQSVLDAYGKHFPGSNPIVVGDIGVRVGRHLDPHHSHQAGRDVDISYPTIESPNTYRRFVRTRVKNLDAKKTLWLLKRFIDTGYVEYIFADRRLQRQLVKEAELEGAPEDWISSVFQYRRKPLAIVRHARGHVNHFHVRFRCTAADPSCRDSIRDRIRELEHLEQLKDGEKAENTAAQHQIEKKQVDDEQEEGVVLP